MAEREDERVCAFEEAHDLSRCFAGVYGLPPLWLLRSGERMIVDWGTGQGTVPFATAWAELSRLGDEIASHLDRGGERWSDLTERWRTRDGGEPIRLLAWATSLDRDTAERLAGDGLLAPAASVRAAANDDDEPWIAARMASALPAEQIRQILTLIGTFERRDSPQLDEVGSIVSAYIADRFAASCAHEQGEAAAIFVREALGVTASAAIDIVEILEKLSVLLYPREVEPRTLDALAIWGRRFGPAVLINLGSVRATATGSIRQNSPARVMLAHELCHRLLDKGHALGAVDVLGGRMSTDIERRAKSFAGEFLLPSTAAAEAWFAAGQPRSKEGVVALLNSLQARFRVPRSVAAWKLDHGLQRREIDLSQLLDSAPPYRSR
ncbi:ImmA/IrrE family metallo-endopeptidase [Methylobacterium sp. D54C]